MKTLMTATALVSVFGVATAVYGQAQSAKPENPNTVGENVSSNAQQSGGTVGEGFRGFARDEQGPGAADRVQGYREESGGTPNPPSRSR
jgi:hypothetical protein